MGGSSLVTMAWRNIWRNRRRTIITLFGIAFGTFLAVLFTGIGDATYGSMIDHSAKLGAGHVTVQHPDYADKPTLKKTVRDAAAIEAHAREDERVTGTVTRIQGAALVATASASQGTFFMAVDPAAEDGTTMRILDSIVEGQMLSSADAKEVVLGYKLAESLGVGLGKKLVYTATDRNGEIVSGLARVKGLVKSGAPTLDASLCVFGIDAVREVLGYEPGEATHVAIFVGDHRDSDDVAADLRARIDGDSVVLTWDEASPEIAGFIAMKEGSTLIMEFIIMLLLAAGIFNTMFVSVMERMREFGIMAALGYSAGSLFVLVMWESWWLAVVGVVVSALVTAFPYYHLNTVGLDYSAMVGEGAEVAGVGMDPIMYVSIFPEHAIAIALAVIAATMASGLYPAWRAGRTNPADVIRLQ